MKPTIPKASRRGISPIPSPLPSGTRPEISGLYFTSPGPETSGAENGSSDFSKGEVNRKPRPKGRRIFRLKNKVLILILAISLNACGIYNFTGGDVGTAVSFTIPRFQNYATQSPGSTFEPGLERDFTQALQDRILNQTSLDLTSSNGDLLYEGEIVEFRISPMSATAQQTAAQNRLSMGVNVRFYNKTKEDADFEQRFSFFYDYPANAQLSAVKDEALEVIFERITQDIFNESLADW